jgi:hypothetical protein
MQNGIIEAPLLQNYALSGEKTFLANDKFLNIKKKCFSITATTIISEDQLLANYYGNQ